MILGSISKAYTWLLAALFSLLVLTIGFHSPRTYSSLLSSYKSNEPQPSQPLWLIATMSPAKSSGRRNIIRSTWQSLYTNPRYTTRFVLSDYNSVWDSLIAKENNTYGDIIRLEGLDPSPQVSNRIKAMELIKLIVSNARRGIGETYEWVSKIDDDAFLEADTFYSQYLNTNHSNNCTLISRTGRTPEYGQFDWPAGAFYTLSWGLAERIAQLQTEHPILDTPEDVLVGKHLFEANVDFDFINLPVEQMFDLRVEGANVPAKISRKAMLMHMIKDDELYLRVANLFDEDGYSGQQIEGLTENYERFEATKET